MVKEPPWVMQQTVVNSHQPDHALVYCSMTLNTQHSNRWISPFMIAMIINTCGTASHSYGASLAIWDHTVLPATRHKWTHPALTTARQAGTRFTYPRGMEGWVDVDDRLHTEMVYRFLALNKTQLDSMHYPPPAPLKLRPNGAIQIYYYCTRTCSN